MKPVSIAGANAQGLTIMVDRERHWVEPWDAVDSVLVAHVPWGNVTVLAAAISLGGGERMIVITEVHPEWGLFMTAAAQALAGFVQPDQWEPAVSQAKRGLMVYKRPPVPRYMH